MNPFLEAPNLRLAYGSREYEFRSKITTSRGSLERKTAWFVLVYDEGAIKQGGLGEVAPLPGLSLESFEEVEKQLAAIQIELAGGMPPDWNGLHSSVRFGLECALADWRGGGVGRLFESPFTEGKSTLAINGLVWMASPKAMMLEAEAKVAQGFRCIKFKIGQMVWSAERKMIEALRQRFKVDELTIRVDANGAYTFEQAMPILIDLAKLQVHSIEQPLKTSDVENLKKAIKLSPIPIALDEQLIEAQNVEDELAFLKDLNPHYIVLKPTLIGGLEKTARWIRAAESLHIGWWITSSLETPIALNALAQFTARYEPELPQGLSTGKIYKDEFQVPVQTQGPHMRFENSARESSYELYRRLLSLY